MSDAVYVNRLKVGETVLAVRGTGRAAIGWPAKFEPFMVKKGEDISLDVLREPSPAPGELVFESGGVWRAYTQPDGCLLLTFRVGRRIYKSALLDQAISKGQIYFPHPPKGESAPRSALQFPLDEMLFQQRWARDGQLEVHSCAVRDRDGVLLFAGHSGAGKSTTARLWTRIEPSRTVLSDDRVVLDPRDPAFVKASGTPWHGMGRFASPGHGRLKALFFLEQAKVTETVRIHPAEAAARLFIRTFPPIWNREVTETVVRTCGEIAERIPAFVLRFRKDRTAIDAARKAVREAAGSPA